MSEEKKARRAEALAAMEKRSQSKPAGPTYWLSRNRDRDGLAAKIDIWLQRPQRISFVDGDVHWLALDNCDDAEQSESAHYGKWTVGEAMHWVGNGYPETDRECIRVGLEPAPEPKVVLS